MDTHPFLLRCLRGSRHRARVTTAAAAVVALLASAAPGAAQAVPDEGLIDRVLADPESEIGPPDPLGSESALEEARALLPESVREVPAVGVAVEDAEAEIRSLEATIRTNRAVRNQASTDLDRLEGERQGHRTQISAMTGRRRSAGQRAAQLRDELGALAVAAYVGAGDPAPGLGIGLDPTAVAETGRQRVMMEAVDTTLRERLALAEAEVTFLGRQIDHTQDDLIRVREEIEVNTQRRDDAIEELAVAEPALPGAQERFSEVFMTSRVEGADFTVVALDAYRTAAGVVNAELPSCAVPWSVLAGIGRVESRHGHYGRSTVRADGTTTRRITGIALDGADGILRIPDTDGGALDGDPVFDRAVGPMQFIPSTWRMVRRDGDGDGRMDPHNLYDAAAAAAAYLCRSHSRLDRPASLNRALLSYNRSQSYVSSVLSHRLSYDRLGLPLGGDHDN
ncbi:MAG: lytic murein transglycosylase [Acidimicrobiales bacterium]|nr:lytic murein transglycosylase [Acidimicrobiales bacterium]